MALHCLKKKKKKRAWRQARAYGYPPVRTSYNITMAEQSHLRPALWENIQALIVSLVFACEITRVGIFFMHNVVTAQQN